ncbi:hypothetical protein F5B21DRAFT_466854 [Xylaria acuta]|nr:hypothetical protein F5B21DRAFT_466854 [Xylaria acuta]
MSCPRYRSELALSALVFLLGKSIHPLMSLSSGVPSLIPARAVFHNWSRPIELGKSPIDFLTYLSSCRSVSNNGRPSCSAAARYRPVILSPTPLY